MEAIDIIRSFVSEHLDGNIDALADYNLWNLRDKKPYCETTCGRFDPDDSLLARAIYCEVFGELWGGLKVEDTGVGKLRGETMNSFQSLLGAPYNDEVPDKWHYDDTLRAKRNAFKGQYHKIGNMMLLPDKRIDDWSINKHRGCCDGLHDYFDRTLDWLYKLMVEQKAVDDEDFMELFELNREAFAPFCSKEGWARFIEGNMLEGYVDSDFVPVVKSKNYTHWKGGYTNMERYLQECNRYIDDSTAIIHDRGRRIVEVLKKTIALL